MSDVAHWSLVLSYSETAQQNFMKLSSSEGHVVYRYAYLQEIFLCIFFPGSYAPFEIRKLLNRISNSFLDKVDVLCTFAFSQEIVI